MARKIIGVIVVLLLVAPATLQALAWTPINLFATIFAVIIFVAVVKFSPRWKWLSAIAASLLIAVPPYPNWVWASNGEGWQFHLGYKLQHISEYLLQFGVFFAINFLLFLTLSWAMKPYVAVVRVP